jgi:DNA-binding GntR family transcriptional regulator
MATTARPATEAGIGSPLAKGIDTTRLSSGDQAALYIRRLIFDGDLRPGTRVPQDEIAQTLGVSRIPVREALIALEREGWVTIELHRGALSTPSTKTPCATTTSCTGWCTGSPPSGR